MNREEKNARQRAYRQANKNASTNKYEKTRSGFLMRKYRNMKSRVTGVQYLKEHLYGGKELLDREDFYEWAINSPEFDVMFTEWESSNYDIKLCPTVDRKDADSGYVVSNMQWLTHSENSRKGALSNKRYGDV